MKREREGNTVEMGDTTNDETRETREREPKESRRGGGEGRYEGNRDEAETMVETKKRERKSRDESYL